MATNKSGSFTDSTSSDAIQSLFDKALLIRGTYALVHHVPMFKKPLSQRNGKTMIFRRYDTLPLATVALTEGVNPAGRAKTKTDIAATISLYGDYTENTDLLLMTQPEAVRAEDVELLGQQMGETIDQIDRDEWATATNTVFANGTSTLTVTEIGDKNDIDRAHRLAKNNKAREFTPMIMASQKIGTGPIMPSYWGLCHEDVAFDLRNVDGFKLASEYGNVGSIIKGEFGASKNGVRYLSSPNGFKLAGASGTTAAGTDVKNTGGFVDVYSLFVVGQQAAASINLQMGNGGVITHDVGSAGTGDPLNLRQTTGWKKYYVPKVLNQAFFVEVQLAASL